MQIYVVGGAVRDTLLGKPVQDRDYVVVGATPEQMVALGYKPVGQDFPVFLHPRTKEEYALARTERKTARGYHGFSFYYAPEVTLEQDLARRDLTINAMACPVYSDTSGTESSLGSLHTQAASVSTIHLQALIDPFGGVADLQAGILRHVSSAFSEDPVRILRAARFAARFATFDIAPETLTLMRAMVASGEVDALVPERVWQELATGLMNQAPERLFTVLKSCGALYRLMPELDGLFSASEKASSIVGPQLPALEYAAQQNYTLPIRFAVLVTSIPITPAATALHAPALEIDQPLVPASTAPFIALCQRLKVPNACKDLALLVYREHTLLARTLIQDHHLQAAEIVALLERCDAFRKPERLYAALQVCQAHQMGGKVVNHNLSQAPAAPLSEQLLPRALDAARDIPTSAIAAQYPTHPQYIKQALHHARIAAVELKLK